MMIDMEHYIQKALEFEEEFHRRVQKHGRLPRPQSEIPTLSPKHLFLNNETIAVKIHQTKALGFPGTPPNPFLHRHDFFEFNYVYRGQVNNRLNGTTVMQGSDQLLLMNPLAIHDPQPVTEDTILFNILVERTWAESVLSSLLTFNEKYFHFFMDQLYGTERCKSYLLFDCTPELSALLQEIIREYYDQIPCYQQMLLARLMELFVSCTRQSYKTHREEEQKHLQSKTITDILTYLRTHYATATLTEIAARFGYSASHLSRMIKQETGQNFCEILRKLKLENACNFLVYSNLSMEMITEHIGYKDPGHFSKAFTKYYGMSPSQYRRENQQTAN